MNMRRKFYGRSRRGGISSNALVSKRAKNSVSRARIATLKHLIATFQQAHGRAPTDREVAGLLACSEQKAARYRSVLEHINER